ncbi:MAG: hypothetical protein RIR39_2489 [Pseudomonadota bacterium]|jgi:hypothetical protein
MRNISTLRHKKTLHNGIMLGDVQKIFNTLLSRKLFIQYSAIFNHLKAFKIAQLLFD